MSLLNDSALTVISAQVDRVMVRVPLPSPANSVAVNFDSTRAFAASPQAAVITPINLDTNTALAHFALDQPVKPTSQIVFAPHGLRYLSAGDAL